jgi:hypothetical protein
MKLNFQIDRKTIALLAAGCLIAVFFFLQVRAWREFDLRTFWVQTTEAEIAPIAAAVALIYLAYVILALRWKILLQPLTPSSLARIFTATAIGFTGLVALGRPGDLVRPYLIARSENVSFSSQVAIWVIERLFDLLAAGLLIVVTLIVEPSWSGARYLGKLRLAGAILFAIVLILLAMMFILRRRIQAWVVRLRTACLRIGSQRGAAFVDKIETFRKGLYSLETVSSFLKVIALSVLLWLVNAVAYWLVIRAYPEPLRGFGFAHAAVLMGFGIAGSVVQLPAIGGGAQLMTTAALVLVFGAPKELAVSCGIALWLVSFASVVPVGIVLARREGLSIWSLFRESAADRKELSVS